jgi:hypothetical protein
MIIASAGQQDNYFFLMISSSYLSAFLGKFNNAKSLKPANNIQQALLFLHPT